MCDIQKPNKRKYNETNNDLLQHFLNLENIMSCSEKRNKKFIDILDPKNLLSISEIRQRFSEYQKFDDHRIYGQSIVWYDVGAMFFLLYIFEKYPDAIESSFTRRDIVQIFDREEKEHLEWVKQIDLTIDEDENPKIHLYVKDGKFIFDPKIIKTNCNKIQILMVSHSFTGASGHMGCLFICKQNAYYYDSNGLKDEDEKDYYDKFILKLSEILVMYEIIFQPYGWKRGIQSIQNNEECKYGLDITGMCCSWSYLIIELKLTNPELTVEEIEQKIKRKYRNRLTRYVVSYQQQIHLVLLNLSNQIFEHKI